MTAQPWPLVIEPEALAQRLDDTNLLIVDFSKEENFLAHHVPGAIHVSSKSLVNGAAPAPGKLPTQEQLTTLFSSIGLSDDSQVIVYDDEGGGWAGRMIWTLDLIGHSRYSYLNGGLHAWLAESLPTESGANPATPSAFTLSEMNPSPRVDADYIMERIGTGSINAGSLAIWDARSPAEYAGTKVLAQKGGHIPGAVNFEWTQGMDKGRALRIRDAEELKSELAALGITADKEIITHCQTHHRSGFTYLLGKVLGFDQIKAYDGSWSEWGNHPDTPVESN